jgi:hypothetical protein
MVEDTLERISSAESLKRIISLIPQARGDDLEEIAYILANGHGNSAALVIGSFISEVDENARENLTRVLHRMGKGVSKDLSAALTAIMAENIPTAKELFKILKSLDRDETHLVARKMLESDRIPLRIEALEEFAPHGPEEVDLTFRMLDKEKNADVKDKIFAALLRTNDKDVIANLFNKLRKGSRDRAYLLELVRHCGDFKVEGSIWHLGNIVSKRPFFNTKRANELRVAAIVSLAQLGTPEAIAFIEKAVKDRSEPVSRMSRMMLELGKAYREQQLKSMD